MCFLSPYLFASTVVTSSLNGVDSFAWVALFRYRKGVLLKTVKTAVFWREDPCYKVLPDF